MNTQAAQGAGDSHAGGTPARLGHKRITVTTDQLAAISAAAQPYRLQKAAELRERAKWAQVELAAAGTYSRREIARAGDWYNDRADSLEKPLAVKWRDCGTTIASFMTPEGEVIEKPVGCNQPGCESCAQNRARRLYNRTIRGARAAIDKQREDRARIKAKFRRMKRRTRGQYAGKAWPGANGKRRLELVTLTIRHTGDVAQDAAILRDAWPLFRARWHKRARFAFTFSKFQELSPGQKRDGHVHWHMLAWLPPVCWRALHAMWWGALNSAREKHGLEPVDSPGNLDFSTRQQDASKIAVYATKAAAYASKSATDFTGLDPETVGAYLLGEWGQRSFTTSVGYFTVEPTGCVFLGFRYANSDHNPSEPGPQSCPPGTGPP